MKFEEIKTASESELSRILNKDPSFENVKISEKYLTEDNLLETVQVDKTSGFLFRKYGELEQECPLKMIDSVEQYLIQTERKLITTSLHHETENGYACFYWRM